MHVGIDARFLCRPLRGMPMYVLHLCEWLPRLRPEWQFTLFINRGFEHNDREDAVVARLAAVGQRPNTRFVNLDHDGETYWEQVQLRRALRKSGVDVIHMPGNRCQFFCPVPQVVTVHDVMEVLFMEKVIPVHPEDPLRLKAYWWRRRAYVQAIYRVGLRGADRLITVPGHSARDIEKHLGISPARIATVHHGADEDYRAASDEVEQASLGERHHCLMLGADSFQKNARSAIQAWSMVSPDIRKRYPLRVCGFAGGSGSPLLEAIREFGLEPEVSVEGWLPKERLVAMFREAAVFLFLSLYEGFGFPLLQAMASGVPCIYGNVASLPEIASGAGMGVIPTDPAMAARAVEMLLTDEALWHENVRQGWQAASKYSWENAPRQHLSIYEEVGKR